MTKFTWLLMVLLAILVITTTLNGVEFNNDNFSVHLLDKKSSGEYLNKLMEHIHSKNVSVPVMNYISTGNFKILGKTDNGYVTCEGPFGNQSSQVKVAYIIGVHPMEWRSHLAIRKALMTRSSSLKYSYYLYRVQVLQDREDYNNGRINGQNLASEFVIPDIKDKKLDLVVDVHSNRGVYEQKRFVAVLTPDQNSDAYAHQLVNKIAWIVYYLPPPEKGPTSGPLISKPLISSGIPTIVYETYSYDPYDLTFQHAIDFVNAVEDLQLPES